MKLRRKSKLSLAKGQLQGRDTVIKKEDGTIDKHGQIMTEVMKTSPSLENSTNNGSVLSTATPSAERMAEQTSVESKLVDDSSTMPCRAPASSTLPCEETKTSTATAGVSQEERASEKFPENQQDPVQTRRQTNEAAAFVFPVEIDFYGFHKATEREVSRICFKYPHLPS